MKKLGLLLIMIAFLFACGTPAQRAEFLSHSTHYQSGKHMKFSWFGHKKPTKEDVNNSALEGWWGDPINFEGEGD
jgi:hypothetical protein